MFSIHFQLKIFTKSVEMWKKHTHTHTTPSSVCATALSNEHFQFKTPIDSKNCRCVGHWRNGLSGLFFEKQFCCCCCCCLFACSLKTGLKESVGSWNFASIASVANYLNTDVTYRETCMHTFHLSCPKFDIKLKKRNLSMYILLFFFVIVSHFFVFVAAKQQSATKLPQCACVRFPAPKYLQNLTLGFPEWCR